jgi:hypothetical protein
MSGQVTITQLPNAAALTGSESVPVVQNGVTVQTTTGAISGAGALNYPFLTVGSTSGLTQARYLSATTGLSITDNGAGSTLTLNMTGAASVLNTVGTGIIVKDSASTVVNRSLTVGAGMTVSNADGVSDNPLISVNTNLQNLSSLSSVGFVAGNGSTFSELTFSGTTNQINIASGDGSSGGPVVSIASNPVLPGTGSVTVPSGTTAQRSGTNGALRYNTTNNSLEAYISGSWATLGTAAGGSVSSVGLAAPALFTVTNSPVTSAGTLTLSYSGTALPVANGGTGQTTYTDGQILIGNSSGNTLTKSTLTAGSNITITNGNGSITIASTSSGGVTSFTAGTTGFTPNTATTGAVTLGGTLNVANGGTGQTSYTDGQLLIGNSTGNTLTKATLTAGANISITNTPGGISIASSGSGSGTVTSVGLSAPALFTVTNSPVTSTGTLTLAYSGTALPVANGGTGGTSASTARSSLSAAQSGANTDITSIALTTGTISTTPSANNDIVNKLYADSIATGINFHAACNYATAASLSGAYTYNNGSSGVGATITGNSFGTLTIDGYTFLSSDVGKRILIKNETGAYTNNTTPSAAFNGVYTLTTAGTVSVAYVLTRATDYDTSGTGTNEIDVGDFILVLSGTANANTSWVQQTPLPITVGTTSLTFIQFGGSASGVSSFSAGSTGLLPSSGTTGAVVLSGTLGVSNGGTGGTSASTARSNLSAAASGSNTDITSIALTTGTITTAASGNNDIVNKSYLESQISGINFHQPVNYATASSLPANTSNSIGIGGTLTANANGALTVDGTLVTSGMRILVKDEGLQAKNGVYTVTQPGTVSTPYILTRATDYDTSGSGTNEVDAGDFLLVISGTVNANTAWIQQTALPITVGTTALSFSLFNAYLAGTGLSLTTSQPTTFSISNTAVTAGSYGSSTTIPTYTVNAQGQLTLATNVAIGTLNQNTTGNAATATSAGKSTNIANGAAGSIPYQTAADTTSFLAIGTSGYVLTQGASAPAWSNSLTLTGNVSAAALIPTSSVIPSGGLYAPSTGTIALASSGSTAIYIDAGQNIAIGNSSPSYKVDVTGAIRATSGFVISTSTLTSPSSFTPDSSSAGIYIITTLGNDVTVLADTSGPSNGLKLIIRVTTSSGTARTITFTGGVTGGFRPIGVTMTLSGSDYTYTTPAAAGAKTVYFGCIYNTTAARWDIVALAQET